MKKIRLILGGRAKPVRDPPQKPQGAGMRTYMLKPHNIISQ